MKRLQIPAEVEPFLSDASNFHGRAEGVVFPETEKDAANFLRECHEDKTPLTISGYGTGLTGARVPLGGWVLAMHAMQDRKSTRLNSSHSQISYAVFCLKC